MWSMFEGPQGMLLDGNAAASHAAYSMAAASAVAPFAATAVDQTKMCASSLIFRAVKWCYSFYLLVLWSLATANLCGLAT